MKHKFQNTYTVVGIILFTSGMLTTYIFQMESYGFLRGASVGAGLALIFNGFFLKKKKM